MRIVLKIHGSLRRLATLDDGPVETEPGITVKALLEKAGLAETSTRAAVIVNGKAAQAGDVLSPDAEVHILLRAAGG